MNLSEWKSYANSILSPAERVKDALREDIRSVREAFPSWEDTNDARWAWFTGAKKIIQTSQLAYLFIRDELTEEDFWRTVTEEYEAIPDHIKEFDIFIRYGFSNMLFTITEELLRSIVNLIDGGGNVSGTSDFYSVYTFLLNRTDHQQYLPLFVFHRLIRNTIHTNGIFRPRDNRNRRVRFRQIEYEFIVGEKISFQSYETLLNLVSEYRVAINSIINSQLVSEIPQVNRFEW